MNDISDVHGSDFRAGDVHMEDLISDERGKFHGGTEYSIILMDSGCLRPACYLENERHSIKAETLNCKDT